MVCSCGLHTVSKAATTKLLKEILKLKWRTLFTAIDLCMLNDGFFKAKVSSLDRISLMFQTNAQVQT
jgi:hypothetical protein